MNYNILRSPGSQVEHSGGSAHPAEPYQSKGYDIIVNGKQITFSEQIVTGQQILEKSGHIPITCFSLYMKLAGCDFEKVSLHQEIDLKNPGLERFVTKDPDVFPYTVNKDPELTQEKELTPREIIEQAGLNNEKVYLVEVSSEGETELAFSMDEPICMSCKGLHFVTRDWIDTVDIEEYGKQCKPVPPAKKYMIKVDKEKYTWSHPTISVEQVIRFVHKDNPSNFNLVKFLGNSPKPVPLPYTGTIDLREKCLVRFVVQPKTQNDGLRTSFSLPEEDTDFLNNSGFQWEAISEGGYMWLIIHNHPVPDGYTIKTCSVALMIPPTYPASEIDMAYFYPHLHKTSGAGINALSHQPIDGKSFQRWSRHRQGGEWKPGVDCVATHLLLVNNWLENDLKR